MGRLTSVAAPAKPHTHRFAFAKEGSAMNQRMSTPRKVGVAVTGVLLGGTLVGGSLVGQSTTANSLQPEAIDVLQQAGLTGIDVSFQGREAYLSGAGKTAEELDQAKQIVQSVRGVRWVKIQGDITQSPTPTGSVTPTPVNTSSSASTTPSPTVNIPSPTDSTPAVSGSTPTPSDSTPTPSDSTPAPTESTPTTTDTSAAPTTLTDAEIAKINNTAIQFGSGVYTLNNAAKQKLDGIIPLLLKSADKVTIRGYVSVPHQASLMSRDSKRRAQVVADYLIANGIPASRIVVKGMGTADPVAPNNSYAGRTTNQRATLTIG